MKKYSLLLLPLITSCSTLNESMQLGGVMGLVGGAAATHIAESSSHSDRSDRHVATGAAIGLGIGLITSYVTHKQVKGESLGISNEPDIYFGDLPPSPFVFQKTNSKGVR